MQQNKFNNTEILKKNGYVGFVPIHELKQKLDILPQSGGVYLILNPITNKPKFLVKGTGGFFKGKDPNVSIDNLKQRWVNNTILLYVGSSVNLGRRIRQFILFGEGRPVGHWAGRYIWQIEKADQLLIAWKKTKINEDMQEKQFLLNEFNHVFGKNPFANISDSIIHHELKIESKIDDLFFPVLEIVEKPIDNKINEHLSSAIEHGKLKGYRDFFKELLIPAANFILYKYLTDIVKKNEPSFKSFFTGKLEFSDNDFFFPEFLLDGLLEMENKLLVAKEVVPTNLFPEYSSFEKADITILIHLYNWIQNKNLLIEENRQALSKDFELLLLESQKRTKYSGEFSTPQAVVDFVLKLFNPRPNQFIYDPCFGYGTFLSSAAKKISDHQDHLRDDNISIQNDFVRGVEINEESYIVGLIRVLLSGIYLPKLQLGDALTLNENEQYDFIFVDPPFNAKVYEVNEFHYPITTNNSDELFVQHMLGKLKPGGYAAIIVPNGFLFRGSATQSLRKYIFKNFSIEAVISLPPGLFLPYTSIPSNIIIIKNSPQNAFIWYQNIASQQLDKKNVTFDIDLEVKKYESKQEGDFQFYVPINKIINNQYDLSYNHYLKNGIDDFIDRLTNIYHDVSVVALGDIASIMRGVRNRTERRRKNNDPSNKFTHPILKVKDIRFNKINLPESELIWYGSEDKYFDYAANVGDIILTASATIGRSALVPNEMNPVFVSDSLVKITVKDANVDPMYLLKLLQTRFYLEWFDSFAKGSIIKHINIPTLMKLKIPILPLELQKKIIQKSNLNDSVDDLLNILSDDYDIQKQTLSKLRNQFKSYRNKLVHEINTDHSEFYRMLLNYLTSLSEINFIGNSKWLNLIQNLKNSLKEYETFNNDASRYVFLIEFQKKLENLRFVIGDNNDMNEIYDELYSSWEAIFTKEQNYLLSKVNINCELLENKVSVSTGLQIKLKNSGAFPLRKLKLKVSLRPYSVDIPILDASDSKVISLDLDEMKPGKYTLNAFLTCEKSNYDIYEEQFTFIYEVLNKVTIPPSEIIITNPYIVGSAIDHPEMFFGRKKIIQKILSHLRIDQKADVIILEGTRRIGKTSILNHLLDHNYLKEHWIPVLCDFQGAESSDRGIGIETDEVFYFLAERIADAIVSIKGQFEIPGMPIIVNKNDRSFKDEKNKKLKEYFKEDKSFRSFKVLLNHWINTIGEYKILLMLDEFDKVQQGVDNKITNPQVFENLRSLLQQNNRISAIFCGSNKLKEMRNEYWSVLYGLGRSIRVSFFENDEINEAKKLIEQPSIKILNYTEDAINKIIENCALQPYLIQSLCSHIFDLCVHEKLIYSVNSQLVKEAIDIMTSDNEHFYDMWNHTIRSNRKKYILLVIKELDESNELITEDIINSKFEKEGISYKTYKEFLDDINELKDLEIIKMNNSSSLSYYSFSIPLFKNWIENNVSNSDIKKRAIIEGESK